MNRNTFFNEKSMKEQLISDDLFRNSCSEGKALTVIVLIDWNEVNEMKQYRNIYRVKMAMQAERLREFSV